jgi:hypothetical protein
MTMSNSTDLFSIFIVGMVLCGVPLFISGVVIITAVINLNQQKAHQRIAQQVGFQALNQESNVQRTWYGGIHHGRRVAIKVIATPYRTLGGDSGSRVGVRMTLRIVMEVDPENPDGLQVQNKSIKTIPVTFEEAFTEKGKPLTHAVRDAMRAFIYMGYPTGFSKDLSLRFSRGLRDLLLMERKAAGKNVLPENVLPDAKAILVHNHLIAEPMPAEFDTLLTELDAIAEAIEHDTFPALFKGKTTPPPEGNGRVVSWIFFGLFFVILPTCLCMCVVAYTVLNS